MIGISANKSTGYVVNRAGLPADYPTHSHDPAFWESLGRAIATFGFLEEVLLKAIFVLTVTTHYEQSTIESVYAAWVSKMTRSLSDPLSHLIDTYGKAVREHPSARVQGLEELLSDLRSACKIRNAICHGSWNAPDASGRSIPFYVNRQGEIFDTPVDRKFLEQLRQATTDIACSVIDTITNMGWQFPGSNGPGRSVWLKNGDGNRGSRGSEPE